MTLIVYNSLSRQKEVFTSLKPGRVMMYVCGPTVYDHAHLGHAKTYVAFDVIVRYLRYSGYEVRYVQNITDVGHLLDTGEDRVLKRAARDRLEPMEVVETFARSYFAAMDALGVTRPDISPRASAHVPEQIEMIEKLLAKGHAYVAGGSVYFDVRSFPDYGKLSGRRLEEQEESGRVDTRDEKRNPEDFALWKRAEPEHILQWNSPWGRGYPGWHIECSAMSAKYLGETFDIHGGGLDNIFPHNESEIAQSEAAHGATFARYWLLTGSLTVEGVKMSKSLGNFTTIKQALQTYRAEALRYFFLTGHYRNPIDYSADALEAAAKGWQRLIAPAIAIRERLAAGGLPPGEIALAALPEIKTRFLAAMDDDFNAPAAIAVLFDLSRLANTLLHPAEGAPPAAAGTLVAIDALFGELAGDILGILPAAASGGGSPAREAALVRLLIDLRAEARNSKNWPLSDSIRDQLAEIGIALKDGKEGTTWECA